jgi:hypothetical protein
VPSYQERPDLALAYLEDIEAGHEREYRSKNYPNPHASASAIIYCLRKAWCRYHPGKCKAGYLKESAYDKLSRTLGTALHAVMGLAEKSTRTTNVPLGVDVGGVFIAGEADAITNGEVWAIEDGKTTRKEGCTYDPNRDPAYVEQLATYLVLHNLKFAEPLLQGVLHIWHIIGCYGSKAKGTTRYPWPMPTSWLISFDWEWLNKWQSEIAERAKIVTGPDLPDPNPYDWECGYCPFASKNGGFCEGPDAMHTKIAGFFPLSRIEVEDYELRPKQDREDGLLAVDPGVPGELPAQPVTDERDI